MMKFHKIFFTNFSNILKLAIYFLLSGQNYFLKVACVMCYF